MVCNVCGHTNEPDVKFCTSCGNAITQEGGQNNAQNPMQYETPPNIPNYLAFSIIVTILCCLPLGIAAIIKSTQVDKFIATGNYQSAMESSKQAKLFCILSAVLGVIVSIIYVIVIVLSQNVPM